MEKYFLKRLSIYLFKLIIPKTEHNEIPVNAVISIFLNIFFFSGILTVFMLLRRSEVNNVFSDMFLIFSVVSSCLQVLVQFSHFLQFLFQHVLEYFLWFLFQIFRVGGRCEKVRIVFCIPLSGCRDAVLHEPFGSLSPPWGLRWVLRSAGRAPFEEGRAHSRRARSDWASFRISKEVIFDWLWLHARTALRSIDISSLLQCYGMQVSMVSMLHYT